MAKKEIFYQGLADLQVAIDDFSTTSPDYFRVTKVPTELYSGLNIFKFKGNPSLFVEGAPVYIEILDNDFDVNYNIQSISLDRNTAIRLVRELKKQIGYLESEVTNG